MTHHDVLVLGGGNAGTSLASHLLRAGFDDVAVVEPRAEHVYRPLLSYVAGGRAPASALTRTQRRTRPRGATWLSTTAERIDPVRREVLLGDGLTVHYRDLVVAVGTVPDWDAWPGARKAYDAGYAASSYVEHTAATAWERLRDLTSGSVVFTLPPEPVPCGPTALKPLLMACDHWRRSGVLGAVKPVLLTAGRPTGVRQLDPHVRAALDDYGVTVVGGLRHLRVDVEARRVTASTEDGERVVEADFLHLVPPYRVPEVVRTSGLAGRGDGGLLDNDPRTFRHRTLAGLWVLGDCATTLNLHSGAALRKQAPVLVHNLQALRDGGEPTYDAGYSAAPVTVSRSRLCFSEFGPEGEPEPSLPLVDLVRPRRSTYLFDRHVLPRLYWRGILRGRL